MLIHGDCLEKLRELPSDSVDSLVTDPPAGISFMGKAWDSDKGGRSEWVAWMAEVMRECLRVMKPGAHGLVWALPRTSHWTATALEDAGFEVRDVITHLFGQGFPKSLDISKAIDKAAGAERKLGPEKPYKTRFADPTVKSGGYGILSGTVKSAHFQERITLPSTDDAKKWSGWGTALKPASEHWILVRKPCSEKTVAANVLEWGTGGINVDGCRIEASDQAILVKNWDRIQSQHNKSGTITREGGDLRAIDLRDRAPSSGRFPANLVLSHSPHCTDEQCDIECAVMALDEQSGISKSNDPGTTHVKARGWGHSAERKNRGYAGDSGGASRFFYCAKISPSERNAGLEAMPDRTLAMSNAAKAAEKRGETYDNAKSGVNTVQTVKNHHPTVKPQKLMRYLCRLVTPPGGTVLDPFMGSGSTGLAAISEGFRFIGIERENDFHAIAQARMAGAASLGNDAALRGI